MPVILANQEAEFRRIKFWSQPGQIAGENPTPKNNQSKTHHTHKKRAGGVAQGVDPEFKPQ
jgi:hypothetical protein